MQSLDEIDRLASVRRSVRAFKPDPVPQDIIKRVLDITLATPSNCNVQPWHIHIISGDALQRLSKAMLEQARAGLTPDHDIPEAGPYPGRFRERQIDAAKRLFAATGVAREDIAARTASILRNYVFFDAPHLALFCVPDWAGERELADCGQAMQSLMFALTAAGLGSCPQGAAGGYAATTHRILGIPADQRILAGISFGYADPDHPSAGVKPPRASVEEMVDFHE